MKLDKHVPIPVPPWLHYCMREQHPKWRFQCLCYEVIEPFKTLTESIAVHQYNRYYYTAIGSFTACHEQYQL